MNSIEHLRAQVGMTQQALAQEAGTSQATIAHYEAGRKSPTLSTLERLAESVGLEAIVSFAPPMTREDHRSLAYHRAIILRLNQDFEIIVRRAKANLKRMIEKHPHAAAIFDQWEKWLELRKEDLVSRLIDPALLAREMRHMSPFSGILSPQERFRILKDFQKRYQSYETL